MRKKLEDEGNDSSEKTKKHGRTKRLRWIVQSFEVGAENVEESVLEFNAMKKRIVDRREES